MKLLLIFLLSNIVIGEVLLPNEDVIIENLSIKGKTRAYHRLNNNYYQVSGPSKLAIYSRLAYPIKDKNIHHFSIEFIYNSKPPNVYEFNKSIDNQVKSSLHPKHGYSESAIIEFDIPEGEHGLYLNNMSGCGKIILLRIIQKELDE